MRIYFCLAWLKAGAGVRQAFKTQDFLSVFDGYLSRIQRFCQAGIAAGLPRVRVSGERCAIWVCHRGAGAKMLSSEQLAASFKRLCDEGYRELRIGIGGAEGFSDREIHRMRPDLLWSFGPLTLPHELAAIVAGEQVYRAWTIMRRLPYHVGHGPRPRG